MSIHPLALFRLSVLGPLASRDHLEQGELRSILRELATQRYTIPNSQKVYLSEKTIEGWYYAWKRDGIEALMPKSRSDRGKSKISDPIQQAICDLKKENPGRSMRAIRQIIGNSGLPEASLLSLSSIHRLLQNQGLSGVTSIATQAENRRQFAASHAEVWYLDVMHGPKVLVNGRPRKVYLISFMDETTRLDTHCAFCSTVTPQKVKNVLLALLKRSSPTSLMIDNDSIYRSETFQAICTQLDIRLTYCRPYPSDVQIKLDHWHRAVRISLLNTPSMDRVCDIDELNKMLWVWLDQNNHQPRRNLRENINLYN